MIPLTDLTTGDYQGYAGGLYSNSSNLMPPNHDLDGIARGQAVRPLNGTGADDPANGKYVLLLIGGTNAAQETCSLSGGPPCNAWSFIGKAAADAEVNQTSLVIVGGAAQEQDAFRWQTNAVTQNYDRVRIPA